MIKGAVVAQLHGAEREKGHKHKRNLTLDAVLSLSWCWFVQAGPWQVLQ